ncbi:NAD(P)-dependent oxidoreductase [Pseudonocardia spinosispora]|uniref:NAD(P)-dependent oxidoreductase n=1 Tax=Pseudonocardia spinosispora TaxID=103441 RepID=UPI0003F5BF5A|nr:SDR family oxidoreductase [Pseudonocardia spinosispora]
MKLTVFGGTGPTGREFVRLSVAGGHEVTAVVRDPAALTELSGLTIRRGDVLDASSLDGSMDGADAVVSALGSRTGRGPTTVYSAGIDNILGVMHAAGVRRLVALTAVPVTPRSQRGPSEKLLDRVLHLFFGGGYDDMARMEQRVFASDVDWTIIRPPKLTDKPGTGEYRLATNSSLRGGMAISRADLALAMLTALHDPAAVRVSLNVAN